VFRSLKRFLQEICRPTLPIILITFFCNRNFFYNLKVTTPQGRQSQMIMKTCKVMVLKTCELITFFKELIM
jgi:hypothetical protein